MDRKTKRLLLLVASCSVAGVVLGGTTSWAESNLCLQADKVTSDCLIQEPIQKTIQGMSTGLLAGAGAAFGVAWNLRHED
ncbi:hypothetical protein Nos7524_4637 [Nostoc sp. PCC 7524]|uniref:hypothetical protein n=1 Tax=Nostoc sp. (strain ATCC 29411 / PCC 7524) TaxID=28072 RepID=UPI00029F4551|nr:hypothetical protein [Nostoc sp. PCC 7524]AFY50385.1 hypothetical protein Nos7524_4637 [Nostoc sp. PCC 7524]